MLNIRGLSIEVSQGDFLAVRFNFDINVIRNGETVQEDYILQEGDIVTLAVLSNPPLRYEQEKPGESSVVFEFPTRLPIGDYSYDISIQFADDKVQTLNWLRQGNLTIRGIARR